MVHNGNELQTKLMQMDFFSSQAILIERCKEMAEVGAAMKEVAQRYNGKKQFKKFIAEVNEKVSDSLLVEITRKGDYCDARVYVTTDTWNKRLYEDRIRYNILFTCWMHEMTDTEERVDAERIRLIVDNQLKVDANVVANAKEDCKNFLKYQQTIIESVCEMYAKIECIPARFRNVVANCVGELTLREKSI